MDGEVASMDNSFKSLGSEGRPRNGVIAGESMGSRGPFQRWEVLEHICLQGGMIPKRGRGETDV